MWAKKTGLYVFMYVCRVFVAQLAEHCSADARDHKSKSPWSLILSYNHLLLIKQVIIFIGEFLAMFCHYF